MKYLCLDEAHIYTGTLGLEISCLLARLQVHLGDAAKDFLPIATSATLIQRGPTNDIMGIEGTDNGRGNSTNKDLLSISVDPNETKQPQLPTVRNFNGQLTTNGQLQSHQSQLQKPQLKSIPQLQQQLDPKEQMRKFFSQLFNSEFPRDKEWFLEDEFEELQPFRKETFLAFKNVDPKEMQKALMHDFPEGLSKICSLFFGKEFDKELNKDDPKEKFDKGFVKEPSKKINNNKEREVRSYLSQELKSPSFCDSFYEDVGPQIFEKIISVSEELPNIILTEESQSQSPSDLVVSLKLAKKRFHYKTGLDPHLLEGLLVLCSHAFQDKQSSKFPALGLRIHVFSRGEPRLYWSFDKKELMNEKALTQTHSLATDFVMCRKCGHQAWGGVYTPTNEDGECGEFKPLPPFYESNPLTQNEGAEILFFHKEEDIDNSLFGRTSWSKEFWRVYGKPGQLKARPIGRKNLAISKKSTHDEGFVFVRVIRHHTKKKGQTQPLQASEGSSCPSCGATSQPKLPEVISTSRAGISTDLSIYGASLLTHLDLESERRLLFFCDNRQETSFLAGFLTERHRRLNLRRAIATYVHEARKSGDDVTWDLLKTSDSPNPNDISSHRFDLAARILLSVKHKKYWGKESLPKKEEIPKSILVDLIPRDVLQVDWQEQKNSAHREFIHYKNWLMDNQSIKRKDSSSDVRIREMRENQELFQSDRGKWCLETFSKVLLIEITGLLSRDSSLLHSGIISWNLKGFKQELFQEYVKQYPETRLQAPALFTLAYWLVRKIAESGQWDIMDPYTRSHTVGKYLQKSLADIKDIIGKGLGTSKGLSTQSQVYRMVHFFSDGNKETIKYWSKKETWLHFLEKGPLERFILLDDEKYPLLKTSKLEMTSDVALYKSSRRQKILCAPLHYPIEKTPTGFQDEFWERVDKCSPHLDQQHKGHSYYKNLYLRSFTENPRLIRASEHNGMIGAKQASSIIEEFEKGRLNTLVATPTLEMGVDLPDLPIVIHRSVPPDPSNYVQRAGRAGRDPKRALLLTYCAHKSHDLVFYESPEMEFPKETE